MDMLDKLGACPLSIFNVHQDGEMDPDLGKDLSGVWVTRNYSLALRVLTVWPYSSPLVT
jgi:hypothetical protein